MKAAIGRRRPAIVAPNVCANCGASDDSSPDGVKLKPCSVCKTAKYCGRGCQVKHWKAHKLHCTAETPAARAEALADLPGLVPLFGAPDLVYHESFPSSPSSWRWDAAVGLVPFEVYNTWRAAEPQRLSAMHKARARAMTTPRPPVLSNTDCRPTLDKWGLVNYVTKTAHYISIDRPHRRWRDTASQL